MKLRDFPAELEAALTRMTARAPAQLPVVVVDAHSRNSAVFIQYHGAFDRTIGLSVCYNFVTRDIPGLEAAAVEFFGEPMTIAPDETFGMWTKDCSSVTRAVEHGMTVLRHVLMLDWDTEVLIDEHAQEPEGGAHA